MKQGPVIADFTTFAIAVAVLAVLGAVALYAQDKYSLKFSERLSRRVFGVN